MQNNKEQFSGLWAVILGGSSGFGLATLEKLAAQGMNIAVLYRETAATDKVVKEKFSALATLWGVTILPLNSNALDNASRTSVVGQLLKATGKGQCVRLLLHSIARGNLKPLMEEGLLRVEGEGGPERKEALSAEDLQLTIYAMSTSLLDWTRALLKEGLFCSDARVIGLTSEGAHKYWEGYAAVSVAKASLESLVTYMAVELSKFGLRTNLIQAGITETPSLKRIPASKQLIELSGARNPLGRMTRPEDVAKVIYLLCTDEAGWINGSLIHVDGGEHCL